jgi:adenylate cyclase
MPKPILPAALSPEMRCGAAAGEVLDAKLREVEACAGAALSKDVEAIHDLRVAVKRLREALRLFRPLLPRKSGRVLLAEVERLNDRLGLARDRDVLSENARLIARDAPESAPSMEGLRAGWGAERDGLLAEALATWEDLVAGGRLPRELRQVAAGTRARRGPLSRLPLDRFAYASILARTRRVRDSLAQAAWQTDPAMLHRLRILVKRLKYTMEPFLRLLPPLADPYTPVADAQEALGFTHDLDVLQAALVEHGGRSPGAEVPLRAVAERRRSYLEGCRQPLAVLGSEAWYRRLLDSLD